MGNVVKWYKTQEKLKIKFKKLLIKDFKFIEFLKRTFVNCQF